MHFFSSAQAQHTSAVQRCLFAYSLADSVQNNLGIVTDVIRKMIKQAFFATLSPSPSLMPFGVTLIPLPDFHLELKFLLRRVAANGDFHAVMNVCDEFRSVCCCQVQKEIESQRQTRQTVRESERDRLIE